MKLTRDGFVYDQSRIFTFEWSGHRWACDYGTIARLDIVNQPRDWGEDEYGRAGATGILESLVIGPRLSDYAGRDPERPATVAIATTGSRCAAVGHSLAAWNSWTRIALPSLAFIPGGRQVFIAWQRYDRDDCRELLGVTAPRGMSNQIGGWL